MSKGHKRPSLYISLLGLDNLIELILELINFCLDEIARVGDRDIKRSSINSESSTSIASSNRSRLLIMRLLELVYNVDLLNFL